MMAHEFTAVVRNIGVNVPVFKVKMVPKRKGNAAKASPDDRFVTTNDYSDVDDEECEAAFFRLNSSGNPETNEDAELMDPWYMEVGEVEYAGEKQITLQLFNSMQDC